MSPLWRNRIQIILEPGAVRVRPLHRGLRPRLAVAQTWAANAAGEPPGASSDWQQPLAYLATVSGGGAWRNADVHVVVRGALVRYRVIPGDANLVGPAERELCARHLFRQVYGPVADAWAVRVAHAGPARPAVAAALDAGLIDALGDVCQAAGARLRRVEPYLAPVANRLRTVLRRESGWLAIGESDRLLLVRFDGGICSSVHAQRTTGSLADSILCALTRETCVGSDSTPAATGPSVVHVYAPGAQSVTLPADAGWTLRQIPPRDSAFPYWP